MMLRLAVTVEGETRYLPIQEGSATLGSSEENDLVIRCPGVSRRHALVQRRGQTVTIRDQGSKNGLVVNGRRVAEVNLDRGTDVVVGRAVLRLEEADTGDAEIALLLERLTTSSAPLDAATETASAWTDATRRLLRWVRLAEHGEARRSELLEDARDLLGATTLMAVKSGFVIADIAGPLPPAEALRELSVEAAPHWLVHEDDADATLCAWFHAPFGVASWRRDFLAFVATKLEGRGWAWRGARGDGPPASEERAPGHRSPDGRTPRAARDGATAEGGRLREADLVFGDSVVRGTSPMMKEVYGLVRQAVRSDLNVLLLGETGAGKEVIARLIHQSDPSRTGPFVGVNMTALAPSLLEAELFGISAGAATDVSGRPGAFRAAQHGTILLDEVGETTPEVQAKLLRVVDSHAVTPVGTSAGESLDVRIIAATNRDPSERVREGTFRADLLFRLNGITITVPPLRARPEDIPALAKSLAEAAAARLRKRVIGFTPAAMKLLTEYDWPGNVRELKNVVDRAVATCVKDGVLDSRDLGMLRGAPAGPVPSSAWEGGVSTAEKALLLDALRRAGGNRSAAARILGISRATLHRRLRKYAIS